MTTVPELVRQHWEHLGTDVDRAHAMYHEDAVLEFPQSGERFEGLANFREWRRRYPASLRFKLRRVTAREDLVADLRHGALGGPRVARAVAGGQAR